MDAYDARHEATSALIAESIDETLALSTAVADTVLQRLVIEGATAVAALAVAVLLGSAIARSITNGLRRLTGSARQIAMVDLPRAVKRVDEQEGLGGLTPFEFAAQTTPPLRAKGRDELAEVGEAFNIVHREAIRVAAQQAMLRHHVGAIFVRLARRGHSLTSRLTSELDEAERHEQDPDRLQRLFRLDHLISLIGRANDSLLVLGGASAAKVRTTDASVSDVLIAAQSRIEYYTRVELVADEGAWVTAPAVDDVVQLLAELMDNATRYSETPAEASAKVLSGRVLVQIRDHGIGIDAARMAALNDRLRRRAPVDLEAMQAMGLTVVGHLAARHGVDVELRGAVGGGVVAEIALHSGTRTFEQPTAPGEPAEPRAIGGGPAAHLEHRDAAPIERRNAARPPERRNAPLFDQRAPAPRPPARGVAEIPARPAAALPVAGGAPGRALQIDGDPAQVLSQLPELRFVTRPVHAEPPLRAGHALPQAPPARELPVGSGGLPQRRPMANLVPGAIAPTPGRPEAPIQRDPRTVGATYSAYARGLAGSRAASTSPSTDTRTSS
jgi:signal transduction histidine kinase